MSEITTAISTVGFPIVSCGALFWYIWRTQDSMRETIQENTIAMNRLCTLVEKLMMEDKEDV